MKKIPKSFRLGPHEYRVVKDPDLASRQNVQGLCVPSINAITIQSPNRDYADSVVHHTFYHELVHAILTAMGEEELNANERFVDSFGLFLSQFQLTAE